MAKDEKRKINTTTYRSNFYGMILGIWTTSVNRGQLPIILFWIAVIIGMIRMPPGDLLNLYKELLEMLETHFILGWILWLLTIIAWVYWAKSSRRIHTDEMNRVADEKKKSQEKALGKKLPSSNH